MNLDRIRNLSRRSKVFAAGGALVLAGFVGGATVAVSSVASAEETSEDGRGEQDCESTGDGGRSFGHHGRGGHGPGGEPLTGDTADQVRAAAEAEQPDGTVVWVTTNPDGGYWAYVLTAEEEKIRLAIDEDFAVTGSETREEGLSS